MKSPSAQRQLKRNNGNESARGEEGDQHYDCEPFASDFNKDGDQDGHQRQHVAFSVASDIKLFAESFVRRGERKTFAVPTFCHVERSRDISKYFCANQQI